MMPDSQPRLLEQDGGSRGVVVTLTGVDGAGKSTQAGRLSKRLTDLGLCAYLDDTHDNFTYFALKTVAARCQRTDIREFFGTDMVEAALTLETLRAFTTCATALSKRGAFVICPRSPWDRIAKAEVVGCSNVRFVRHALEFCEPPDLHFYLDVTVSTAMRRIAARGIDSEDAGMLGRYRTALERLAIERRMIVIDAEPGVANVEAEIWRYVLPLVAERRPGWLNGSDGVTLQRALRVATLAGNGPSVVAG